MKSSSIAVTAALAAVVPLLSFAGETISSGKGGKAVIQAEVKEKSIYDRIWDHATLYKNAENPLIQELSIVGRSQFDWFYFDAEQGQDDDWVVRRTRIGMRAKVLGEFIVHGEVDLNPQDADPLYNKLTDAYLQWAPSEAFKLTLGKHGAKFTLDGWTSSTQLYTIDRSNIANNFWFPEEYAPGVSISGDVGNWTYSLGWFSAGEASPEFGDFNAGSFLVVSGGYNFARAIGADKALLRLDYMYQDTDSTATFTRPNEQVASVNFSFEKDRLGFYTEVVGSQGDGSQSDLFGLQVLPTAYLNDTKTLQLALRYTFINSADDNGIRLARYENRIVFGRGDQYNEIYGGLNWFLYGHKLKLQAGVQYTTMDDSANDGGEYDGWGVTTALRIYW